MRARDNRSIDWQMLVLNIFCVIAGAAVIAATAAVLAGLIG